MNTVSKQIPTSAAQAFFLAWKHDMQAPMALENLNLHIGCGHIHMEEWVNIDLHPTPATDLVFDIQGDWPLPDNCAKVIYASHVLEHLLIPETFFAEAWRVLQPVGGSLVLRMPYGGNKAAWADWNHVRPWYPESFAYLQPGYAEAVGNPQSDKWQAYFGLHDIMVRVSGRLRRWARIPGIRTVMKWYIDWIPEACEELYVEAFPLKTADAIAHYRSTHPANVAPIRYAMYLHDWHGERPPAGPVAFKNLF